MLELGFRITVCVIFRVRVTVRIKFTVKIIKVG